MSESGKFWMFLALILILTGCIVFLVGMSLLNWDFTKISTLQFESKTFALNESFQDIKIDVDTADVELLRCKEGEGSVLCYEEKNAKHSVEVRDGTLVIKVHDERKWYDRIGFSFESPKITVLIPAGVSSLSIDGNTGNVLLPDTLGFHSINVSQSTGSVSCKSDASESILIRTSTGKIEMSDVTCGSMELSVSTGNIRLAKVNCSDEAKISLSTGDLFVSDFQAERFVTHGSTGDVKMENSVFADKLLIQRTTGDVAFEKCDASDVRINTDTGDVCGSFLSGKVFVTKTDTGRIDVAETVSGGRCEIVTDTGDIRVWIEE